MKKLNNNQKLKFAKLWTEIYPLIHFRPKVYKSGGIQSPNKEVNPFVENKDLIIEK
jgi:hypothetical protein